MSSKHPQDPQVSQSDINSSRSELSKGPRGQFWASSDTDEESEIKALQVIDPAYRTKGTKSYWALGPRHTVHRTNVTTEEDTFWSSQTILRSVYDPKSPKQNWWSTSLANS